MEGIASQRELRVFGWRSGDNDQSCGPYVNRVNRTPNPGVKTVKALIFLDIPM